jgi:hypothetical protein
MMCIAEGCDREKAKGRKGYCSPHYYRLHQYGRLELVKTTPVGAPEAFLQQHLAHDGDECLIWPYAKQKGYGVMQHEGRMMLASRRMCILRHGEPAFPGAHAAHSCGKGDQGCVSHVYWATAQENIEDKRKHGTQLQGRQMWNAKLNEDAVRYIRQSGETQEALAKRFGVSRAAIEKVVLGHTWKHVA